MSCGAAAVYVPLGELIAILLVAALVLAVLQSICSVGEILVHDASCVEARWGS